MNTTKVHIFEVSSRELYREKYTLGEVTCEATVGDLFLCQGQAIAQTGIDRLHKWWPKKIYAVFVLIRPTSLVSRDKVQKKYPFRTRLVSLIST